VLFYNGRYNERHDFVALELVDDHVEFSFSLGTDVTRVAAFPPRGVQLRDGDWHLVTVNYLNRVSGPARPAQLICILPVTNYLRRGRLGVVMLCVVVRNVTLACSSHGLELKNICSCCLCCCCSFVHDELFWR